MRSGIRALVAIVLAFLWTAAAWAEDFPTRPITLIIPTSPGGSASVSGQIIAEGLKKQLGQPVEVVYKPGAAQALGTEQVLNAEPDGYTLGWTFEPDLASKMVAEGKNLSFTRDDFTHLGAAGFAPYLMWVKADSPWRNIEDLIAAGRQEELSYSSGGVATMTHVYTEIFARTTGIKVNHVPFQGGGPATRALLGGHVKMAMGSYGRMKQYLDAGLVRPLAVLTENRMPEANEIPTLAEKGYDLGIEAQIYHHLFGPKGMPPAVVEKISSAFLEAVADPDVKKALVRGGFDTRFLDAKGTEQRWLSDFAVVEKALARMKK